MKLLDQVNSPKDIKSFSLSQLQQLSDELRKKTIETVSLTGGHLGAGLGVVELTVALHYIFRTPIDKIIWDVGHQAYPHKILTERKDRITSLRQTGGLSGFTKRDESEYDPFGAGHSSTSISAALGMATARDLNNEDYEVVAVIGDGAMSAGLAYEAMNNAGAMKKRMIVILNDNDMSIAPPVGAMNTYLSKLISSKQYLESRKMLKEALNGCPEFLKTFLKKAAKNTKDLFTNCNFFEEIGFYYIGPVDGHNISHLVTLLQNIKEDKTIQKPILLHVVTEKGKGFTSNKGHEEKYHAVSKFDPSTGRQEALTHPTLNYTQIFANTLIEEAEIDKKIVAITAAMPSGTGLNKFAEKFPDRMFDVGIAEQHAVTFAAGLSCQNIKPFVAIYSTFLQRAYDQIVHDVAIQNLPVRFAIDRAGYVGPDGPTHAGTFDITYLASLPNMVVMAASDGVELARMVKTAAGINDRPSAFRYPRGISDVTNIPKNVLPLQIGKGRIIKEGSRVAILSLGTRLIEAIKAAEILEKEGLNITIADARFAKPLDEELILNLAKNYELLITVEEGSIGGFAAHVIDLLIRKDLSNKVKIKSLFYPDYFIEHSSIELMNKEAGLTSENIINIIKNNITF